jgi:hypothetical protein
MRLIVVGNPEEFHVGSHFLAAAHSLGWEAEVADVRQAWSGNRWINRIHHHLLRKRPPNLSAFGKLVLEQCHNLRPDFLLSTGVAPLSEHALRAIKTLGIPTANFLTDDPWNPGNEAGFFWDSLREYDLIANPRKANLEQLRAHGCRRVEYVPFGYNPDYHRIAKDPTSDEKQRFSCEVAILGGADADRVPLARALAKAKLDLALYGGHWEKYPDLHRYLRGCVFGRDLRLAVRLAGCHVCMGRKANRDGHAMRSIEFPAMGACLLVEDTQEHRELYGPEGEIVAYWSNPAELVEKAKWLVRDISANRTMRQLLHKRFTLENPHRYADRISQIVSGLGLEKMSAKPVAS